MLTGWQMGAILSQSCPLAGSGIPGAQSSGSTRFRWAVLTYTNHSL